MSYEAITRWTCDVFTGAVDLIGETKGWLIVDVCIRGGDDGSKVHIGCLDACPRCVESFPSLVGTRIGKVVRPPEDTP